MIWTLIVIAVTIFIYTRFHPAIKQDTDGSWYFYYTPKRGVRDKFKLF